MNVFYEEEGSFRAGVLLADNGTSLRVEATHGKRNKIKAAAAMFRFEQPGLNGFMELARKAADDIDVDFLWSCCGEAEFSYETLAQEYYGHTPGPVESAALLMRLHGSPMYFYKKGRGRYKAAPPEALSAALASVEKKRKQALQQAEYVQQLTGFKLPAEFGPLLPKLLYLPDRAGIEYKALEAASAAVHLTHAQLIEKCGAIPSPHDYHFQRFLFEHFPESVDFGDFGEISELQALPLAEAAAFSIDDAATTEIDDAFSVQRRKNGNWRIGIHIAAPALGLAPGSKLDAIAARRLSTVYIPGDKITMLPEAVIDRFTLTGGRSCPALSLYVEVLPEDLCIISSETRIERVPISVNLRHAELEQKFNEAALAADETGFPFGEELKRLWQFAESLQKLRGQNEIPPPADYHFLIENGRVAITERKRGTPVDTLVSELMIYVNSTWGKLLAEKGIAAIYRIQYNGKVKMSTTPGGHRGLGVEQYLWASSPLRRYVDLVNQRQLVAGINGEPPPYARTSERLLIAMRDFELAYDAYANFQRIMERYWCLRWLVQESVNLASAVVVRENLVKIDQLPLFCRVPSLPELPAGDRVEVEISAIDFLELNFACHYKRRLETQ
ncbi:MAG: ribonuclease catalytic domain-containing protein [Burkholderiales bacterium]